MKILISSVILILSVYFSSCSDSPISPQESSTNSQTDVVEPTCLSTFPLTAGQTIHVGNVTVYNDEYSIHVIYEITNHSYSLHDLHLWIGADTLNLPVSGGSKRNPVPGQFPYHANGSGQFLYEIQVPLSDLGITDIQQACGLGLYIFAHADVGSETAWGGNTFRGPGHGNGKWYYFDKYNLCCDY